MLFTGTAAASTEKRQRRVQRAETVQRSRVQKRFTVVALTIKPQRLVPTTRTAKRSTWKTVKSTFSVAVSTVQHLRLGLTKRVAQTRHLALGQSTGAAQTRSRSPTGLITKDAAQHLDGVVAQTTLTKLSVQISKDALALVRLTDAARITLLPQGDRTRTAGASLQNTDAVLMGLPRQRELVSRDADAALISTDAALTESLSLKDLLNKDAGALTASTVVAQTTAHLKTAAANLADASRVYSDAAQTVVRSLKVTISRVAKTFLLNLATCADWIKNVVVAEISLSGGSLTWSMAVAADSGGAVAKET